MFHRVYTWGTRAPNLVVLFKLIMPENPQRIYTVLTLQNTAFNWWYHVLAETAASVIGIRIVKYSCSVARPMRIRPGHEEAPWLSFQLLTPRTRALPPEQTTGPNRMCPAKDGFIFYVFFLIFLY